MIAAILAGGSVDAPLASALGHSLKALGRLGGSTLLERAIAAARGSGATRVVVIGDEPVRAACAHLVEEVVPTAGDGSANLARALAFAGDAPLAIFSSDLPFITAESAARFFDAARASGAEIALPLTTAQRYGDVYPGAPPHITTLGGERVANGSVFYFARAAGPKLLVLAQSLFEARKSLTRMALLLGPQLALKYATRSLRIDDIERRARARFGVDARAVRDCAPDLCFDIDDLADYTYALRLIGERDRS